MAYNAALITKKLTNSGDAGFFDTGTIGEAHHVWIQRLFTEEGIKDLESFALNNGSISRLYPYFLVFFATPTAEKAKEIEKLLKKLPKVKVVKKPAEKESAEPEKQVLDPDVCQHCGRGGQIIDLVAKLIDLIIAESVSQTGMVIRPAKK